MFCCTLTIDVQSLLGDEKKPDIYALGVADGIRDVSFYGFTKICNTTVSNLAETLHIDYYVALIIHNPAKEV